MSESEEPTILERTLSALWLYIGHYAETQLATPEREALADAVEKVSRWDDPDDPVVYHRWWREDCVSDFQYQLQANRTEIARRRDQVIARTGRTVHPNRSAFLRAQVTDRFRGGQ